VPHQVRGLGLAARCLLPKFRRLFKLSLDVRWKGNRDVQLELVGRDVVHDDDEVARHRLDLPKRARLSGTGDLRHVDAPDLAVPVDFGMVGPQFRYQPFPNSASHSWRMSSVVRRPISGWRGIGIFTDPSQNVSCLAPSTCFHTTPCRLASCLIFLMSSDRLTLLL